MFKKIATTNEEVIRLFLEDSFPKDKRPEWGTGNLKIQKRDKGWALVNYTTALLYRPEGTNVNVSVNDVYFNIQKHSVTTSRIQNQIRAVAEELGIELIEIVGDAVSVVEGGKMSKLAGVVNEFPDSLYWALYNLGDFDSHVVEFAKTEDGAYDILFGNQWVAVAEPGEDIFNEIEAYLKTAKKSKIANANVNANANIAQPENLVAIFDNGRETADRYTVVFDFGEGQLDYLGLSDNPGHPQGFSQWGEISRDYVEDPAEGDMEIEWVDLPEKVQDHILGRLVKESKQANEDTFMCKHCDVAVVYNEDGDLQCPKCSSYYNEFGQVIKDPSLPVRDWDQDDPFDRYSKKANNESEDEDEEDEETDVDQTTGEEMPSDEFSDRLYSHLGNVIDALDEGQDIEQIKVEDDSYEWLEANGYTYLVEEYISRKNTKGVADALLEQKRDEMVAAWDALVGRVIEEVPGTEISEDVAVGIRDVDWSYPGDFELRAQGWIINEEHDSYAIPTVEIWSSETEVLRYGHIATVPKENDIDFAVNDIADNLLNPTNNFLSETYDRKNNKLTSKKANNPPGTEKLEKWQYAENYMGEGYPNYYVVYSQSRDSDVLDQSNFASALDMLGGEAGIDVIVVRSSHWASGWVEVILVHENSNKLGVAVEIATALEEYAILDEEDYSDRENESYRESYDSWARLDAIKELNIDTDKLTEDDEQLLYAVVYDSLSDSGGDSLYDLKGNAEAQGLDLHRLQDVENLRDEEYERYKTEEERKNLEDMGQGKLF